MIEIIVVLVACLLLLLPIRNAAWRKLRPVIAVLVLSFLIVPMVPGVNDRVNVRIQPLRRGNVAAEANEIRLEAVSIDGEEQELASLFPGNNWIDREGRLSWRSYDEGIDPSLYDQWPAADTYEIAFQKTKWRGMVEVQIGSEVYTVDCYAPVEYGESEILTTKGPARTSVLGKLLYYAAFALVLCLICLLVPLLMRSARSDTRDPGPVVRESWSDVLRMLSVFLIVLVGTSGRTFEIYGLEPPSGMSHLLLYSFESFAFPIFLMLTGAFLLRRDEDPLNTLTRRVPSVLVPLVGLAAVAFMTNGYFSGSFADAPPASYVLQTLFGWNDATPWFLLILTLLYILAPVFRPLFVQSNRQAGGYAVCLLYLLPSAVYTGLSLLGQVNIVLTCAMILSYLGQFLFGAHLVSNQEKWEGKWVRPALMMLAGYGLTVGLRLLIINGKGIPAPTVMTAGLDSALFSGGMMALFMSGAPAFMKLPLRLRTVIKQISSLGIGILMVHSVLMRQMPTITLGTVTLQMNARSLWDSVALGAVYIVLALAISYIISVVPVFKRVIGLDWYSANDPK